MRELLAEIGRWWTAATGRTDIPALWRILARNPHYLESTWQKEPAVMQAGALGRARQAPHRARRRDGRPWPSQ